MFEMARPALIYLQRIINDLVTVGERVGIGAIDGTRVDAVRLSPVASGARNMKEIRRWRTR